MDLMINAFLCRRRLMSFHIPFLSFISFSCRSILSYTTPYIIIPSNVVLMSRRAIPYVVPMSFHAAPSSRTFPTLPYRSMSFPCHTMSFPMLSYIIPISFLSSPTISYHPHATMSSNVVPMSNVMPSYVIICYPCYSIWHSLPFLTSPCQPMSFPRHVTLFPMSRHALPMLLHVIHCHLIFSSFYCFRTRGTAQ